MMQASDPVAAITEAAATGETARTFADIRETLRVPVVNLIWRHLATMPGALPWIWQSVKPLYGSAELAEATARFRQLMTVPAPPPVEPETAPKFSPGDLAGIGNVLASYDQSSTVNLLVLGAFLDGPATGARPRATPVNEPDARVLAPLPFLIPLTEMPADLAALVSRLNAYGEESEQPILASMWRHLAHWPEYLLTCEKSIGSLDDSGDLRKAILANRTLAADLRAPLRSLMAMGQAPAEPTQATARHAIESFVAHPIGKMVTICRILRQQVTEFGAG